MRRNASEIFEYTVLHEIESHLFFTTTSDSSIKKEYGTSHHTDYCTIPVTSHRNSTTPTK